MKKKNLINNLAQRIERYLPMTFGSFFIFLLILYFMYIVGRTTSSNFQSNQTILSEEEQVRELEAKLVEMQNQTAYFKTASFKEREAREKLAFRSAGEQMMSLPFDQPEDKSVEAAAAQKIKTPNYRLWWRYFFGS